jgi:hypothetical protein
MQVDVWSAAKRALLLVNKAVAEANANKLSVASAAFKGKGCADRNFMTNGVQFGCGCARRLLHRRRQVYEAAAAGNFAAICLKSTFGPGDQPTSSPHACPVSQPVSQSGRWDKKGKWISLRKKSYFQPQPSTQQAAV